jgi:hypothetical protein
MEQRRRQELKRNELDMFVIKKGNIIFIFIKKATSHEQEGESYSSTFTRKLWLSTLVN